MSGANESTWRSPLAALDANLLVALDAILAEVNVTRAARRIGVTQSAMSQTLARLRRHFDDPLLVRVGRNMELSAFAARIQLRLHEAMTELAAIVGESGHFDPKTTQRRFSIATTDYVAAVVVPALHQELARTAPRASLAVHAVEAEPLAERLAQGLVDLYVGVIGERERGLSSAPLLRDSLVVMVRAGHPLAKKPLTASAFAACEHILVSPRRDPSSLVDRALRDAGLARRIALEVPFFGIVPDLLASSDLVATLPASIAATFASDLVTLAPPIALPALHIGIAWHPAFETEPASMWLRKMVRTASGKHT